MDIFSRNKLEVRDERALDAGRKKKTLVWDMLHQHQFVTGALKLDVWKKFGF